MSNYSLIVNSQFQPFTYQELAAPVIHQQQVMDNLAEQYDKLSSQADVLEAMAANENDKNSPTYARFKAYTDSLKSEADNLYRNGLDSESRMRLSELRRRYNSEIVPIQNAWTKREQEAQLQMKAQLEAAAKGIDIRFSRNAADTPLQSYIENPNQTFRTINGQQLASEVANQFKGLASQIQFDRNGNPWIGKKQLSPIEYSIITQKGMDFNQFSDFMNNPDDPNYANIRGIINNTLMSHGISDFDERTQREMFGLASQGVAAGVGARDMQMHVDPYAKAMLDLEIANQKAAAKANAESGAGGIGFDVSEYQLPMTQGDKNNPAQYANVHALNYEKNTWNPTSKNYMLQEIKGYKDGKPRYDSKRVSLNSLLNKKDGEGNISVAPYWSTVAGQEGLILATTEDGEAKRYFIGADQMPENNIQTARQWFAEAERQRKMGNAAGERQAKANGLSALHRGLTLQNDAQSQKINRQPSLNQSGVLD